MSNAINIKTLYISNHTCQPYNTVETVINAYLADLQRKNIYKDGYTTQKYFRSLAERTMIDSDTLIFIVSIHHEYGRRYP